MIFVQSHRRCDKSIAAVLLYQLLRDDEIYIMHATVAAAAVSEFLCMSKQWKSDIERERSTNFILSFCE
jgi:hypothetical protein